MPWDEGAAAITAEVLQPVVAEALARWSATDLTRRQLTALANFQFAVADLGGGYLGLANAATSTIRIDDDAAMFGWSVVSCQSSVASGQPTLITGQSSLDYEPRTTDQGQMTTDGMDFLTVVMHELGHLLGLEHSDDPDDLMAPVLAAGANRLPSRFASASLNLPHNLPHNLPLNLSPNLTPPRLVLPASVPRADEFSRSPLCPDATDELFADLKLGWDEETSRTRVPRRSRMARFERDLDQWFAQGDTEADCH